MKALSGVWSANALLQGWANLDGERTDLKKQEKPKKQTKPKKPKKKQQQRLLLPLRRQQQPQPRKRLPQKR